MKALAAMKFIGLSGVIGLGGAILCEMGYYVVGIYLIILTMLFIIITIKAFIANGSDTGE